MWQRHTVIVPWREENPRQRELIQVEVRMTYACPAFLTQYSSVYQIRRPCDIARLVTQQECKEVRHLVRPAHPPQRQPREIRRQLSLFQRTDRGYHGRVDDPTVQIQTRLGHNRTRSQPRGDSTYGATQFTRIPLRPTSPAALFVNPITACFVAEYTAFFGCPSSPGLLAAFTRLALSVITSSSARMQ